MRTHKRRLTHLIVNPTKVHAMHGVSIESIVSNSNSICGYELYTYELYICCC